MSIYALSATGLFQPLYTPSARSQAAQTSSVPSTAVSTSSQAQGGQGDTVTLAGLLKNQTISGSADVRQVLLDATLQYVNENAIVAAWDDIGVKVKAGDYSGALKDLGEYTKQLTIAVYDTSLVKKPVDALESALQAGNAADVQTAYTAFRGGTPEGLMYAQNLGFSGDAKHYAAVAETEILPGLTDELQKVGYTATNAAAEANAIVLGIMVDGATLTVKTVDWGSTSDLRPTSDLPQVDQSISYLARAAANSSDSHLMSSIIASLDHVNSVTTMESALTQLDIKYGNGAQGTGTENASQAGVSVYA